MSHKRTHVKVQQTAAKSDVLVTDWKHDIESKHFEAETSDSNQ
jgi:hypothetical protein